MKFTGTIGAISKDSDIGLVEIPDSWKHFVMAWDQLTEYTSFVEISDIVTNKYSFLAVQDHI